MNEDEKRKKKVNWKRFAFTALTLLQTTETAQHLWRKFFCFLDLSVHGFLEQAQNLLWDF